MRCTLTILEDALQRLLRRENADAFVIFSDKNTGRFIQFAGSAYENLLLDLPVQTLSDGELEKTNEVLKQYGVSLGVTQLLDKPDGVPTSMQYGFNIDFGNDYKSAANTTHYLMQIIYSLSDDFDLAIEEN
ncbi:MAG: hypothetical protein GQ569_04260 [Methylococcaceae bacterium]|nr:hypothetical protein [Methylococcaceae bacterium]